jgi:hypothetical protein
MNRSIPLAAAFMVLAITAAVTGPRTAAAEDNSRGKTCRMEQQCRWENFKKICTWVKVCR